MKNCAAIILAAGKGTRLSKTANKIFLDLAGKSLLQRSLENIARFKRLSSIILVISQKDKQKIKTLLNSFAVKIPVFLVFGGKERFQSSILGVQKYQAMQKNLASQKKSCFFIQDLARPFTSLELLEELYQFCGRYKIAIPYLIPTDTFWQKKNNEVSLLKREDLMSVQTPQFFDDSLAKYWNTDFLKETNDENKPSDDLFFVANKKIPIRWVKGENSNIKITTANDLELAKFYLSNFEK